MTNNNSLGVSVSSARITMQLFGWAMLMTLILICILGVLPTDISDLLMLPLIMEIFGWPILPPTIVGLQYTKKYQVTMSTKLRKYSAIYYMSLSCFIGLLLIIPLLFIAQTEKPIDDFGISIVAVLLFFVGYFLLGTLSVYSNLKVELPEKNLTKAK